MSRGRSCAFRRTRRARGRIGSSPELLARVQPNCGTIWSALARRSARVTRGEFRIQYNGAAVFSAGRVDSFAEGVERIAGTALESAMISNKLSHPNRRRSLSRPLRRVWRFWASRSGEAGLSGTCTRCSIAGRNRRGSLPATARDIHLHKSMGLVQDIFHAAGDRAACRERCAIGHTRYSTAGDNFADERAADGDRLQQGKTRARAQRQSDQRAAKWRRKLEHRGSIFQTTSDTEVIVHLVARSSGAKSCPARWRDALNQVEGAYSLLVLTRDEMYAIRDPRGFRPLALGRLDGAWVVASETCAFDLIEREYVRDIEPGEMVRISRAGIESMRFAPEKPHQHCIFEHVYFSRPDSLVFGRPVDQSREMLGRLLAARTSRGSRHRVPVPDSGVPAAMGYAAESGIPFRMGADSQSLCGAHVHRAGASHSRFWREAETESGARMIEGKRVVLVDDSIVRGTTSRKIVRLVRDAGATEVHVRISCPPTISPCYYGVDTPTREELIAARNSVEEIRKFLGADSLGYLSLPSLRAAVEDTRGKILHVVLHRQLSDGAGATRSGGSS